MNNSNFLLLNFINTGVNLLVLVDHRNSGNILITDKIFFSFIHQFSETIFTIIAASPRDWKINYELCNANNTATINTILSNITRNFRLLEGVNRIERQIFGSIEVNVKDIFHNLKLYHSKVMSNQNIIIKRIKINSRCIAESLKELKQNDT
jgi:hypothetical protein